MGPLGEGGGKLDLRSWEGGLLIKSIKQAWGKKEVYTPWLTTVIVNHNGVSTLKRTDYLERPYSSNPLPTGEEDSGSKGEGLNANTRKGGKANVESFQRNEKTRIQPVKKRKETFVEGGENWPKFVQIWHSGWMVKR